MVKADSHGAPSGGWSTVECYGWFRVGVARTSFARLVSFDAVLLETFDGLSDAGINLTRHGWRWGRLILSLGEHGSRSARDKATRVCLYVNVWSPA
jgi:hypothetical protein